MNKTKWEKKNGKLVRMIEFSGFKEAINFVIKLSIVANDLEHHPDIKIHDYNKVTIETFTQDTHSITKKDYELTERIDKLI